MNGKFLTKIIYSCLAFIGVVGVSSCDALYEDLPECVVTYKVRFTYDMNIKFADAFSHEVDKVTLYVFDSDDRLVWQRTESGESVKARLCHDRRPPGRHLRHDSMVRRYITH